MRKVKEDILNISDASNPMKCLELVYSGEDYFTRLMEIISKAKFEIHLQTYIFENDSTGFEIVRALKEAANRKVRVYILLDGYGSSKLPSAFFDDLVNHGIHIRLFSPWYSKNNFYIGRRLHHKVLVADGEFAIIGGINIANKYRGSRTELPWLDYAVQIHDTAIAEGILELCKTIYFKERKHKIGNLNANYTTEDKLSIKILRNDWLKRKNEIHNGYIAAIRKANKEIIILASYFLPGRRISNELRKATEKGVKIKIILSGVSDLPIVMKATKYLYASLLRQGIELFEWKKSVLHGKLMCVDSKWATVGSFNLNHLSSYASIEMNVGINSQEFSQKLFSHLIGVIKECENVSFETLKMRNGFFSKWQHWFAYQLVRIALTIATYIPQKRFLT